MNEQYTSHVIRFYSCRDLARPARLADEVIQIPMVGSPTPDPVRRNAIILVHGYNNDWKEVQSAYESIARIFHDVGAGLDVYGFTWPSRGHALSYKADLRRARKSAPSLTAVATDLRKQGYQEVFVLAHSMGGVVACEALLHMFNAFNAVAFHAADVKVKHCRPGGKYDPVGNLDVFGTQDPIVANFYSDGDNDLSFWAQLVRPGKRIGGHPVRELSAKLSYASWNWHDVDAEDLTGKRIDHDDYKSSRAIIEETAELLRA